MHFLSLMLHVVLAAIAALAVFALVLKLVLTLDRTFGLQLERMRERWRRRPEPAQPVEPIAPTVETEAEWETLTGLLESRADRLHAVSTLQERAGHCIEAAEYALDRLLLDCAAVMLTPDASAQMQRRRAALADMPAAPRAALPETLAA